MPPSRNPWGHPVGSRNQRGHDAGGQRSGAGRPSNEDQLTRRWEEGRRISDQRQHEAQEAGRESARAAEILRQREAEKVETHANAVRILRSLSAESTNENSLERGQADEEEEEEHHHQQQQQETQGIGEEKEEPQKHRKYKRASYQPKITKCH